MRKIPETPDPARKIRERQAGECKKGPGTTKLGGPRTLARRSAPEVRPLAAEVHKLQVGLVEALQQVHGLLEIIAGLRGHPELVALDL